MGTCNIENNRKKIRENEIQETTELSNKSKEQNTKKDEIKNTIKNSNNNGIKNNINQNINETESNNKDIETNDINQNKNENMTNFYLICPKCGERSPHIEKINYDSISNDFLVNYTCLCFENSHYSNKEKFINLLRNKKPSNLCNKHLGNKLISFCKNCNKAICSICKSEEHKTHNIKDDIENNMQKEEVDKMLNKIKEKEDKFNNDINLNEENMEKGIDNLIQQLNKEKQNYKQQIENYKDNNQKKFNFLKNLYSSYLNNNLEVNQDNNINFMLENYIKKFTVNNNIPELNSNVNEIIKKYNVQEKELKFKYDYNFINTTKESLEINLNQAYQTFKGHTEKIVALIQLSSGKLASGSYDKTIRVWNIHILYEEKIINENGKVFCLLEFEKDKLLCGTSRNMINLWDLNSNENKCISSFIGHGLWVNCLVKCNENYFASASNDRTIKIWDYYNKTIIQNLIGHKDCVLSLILLRNNNLCSGSADNTIKIWDWENGTCIKTLEGHQGWVKSVFELHNEILLSGSGDKTIKIWKDYENIKVLYKHEHAVRTFCQINNNYFASGSFDSTIKIWNINSWKCVKTLYGHQSNVLCLIPINNLVEDNYYTIASCSNDKTIKIWKINLNI